MCRIPNSDLGRRVVTVMIGLGKTMQYVRDESDIPASNFAMLKEAAFLDGPWTTKTVGEYIGLTDKVRTERGITHIRPAGKDWKQHQAERRIANRKRARDERPRPRALPDLGLRGRERDLHAALADLKVWTRLSASAGKVRGGFLWCDLSETSFRRVVNLTAASLAERGIIDRRLRGKGRSAKWVEVRVRPRFRAYRWPQFGALGPVHNSVDSVNEPVNKGPLSGAIRGYPENVSTSKACSVRRSEAGDSTSTHHALPNAVRKRDLDVLVPSVSRADPQNSDVHVGDASSSKPPQTPPHSPCSAASMSPDEWAALMQLERQMMNGNERPDDISSSEMQGD